MARSEAGMPEQKAISEPKANILLLGGVGPLKDASTPALTEDVQRLFGASGVRCGALFCDRNTHGGAGETGQNAIEWLRNTGLGLVSLCGVLREDLQETLGALGGVKALGVGTNQAMANRAEIVSINGVRLGFIALNECSGDRERYAPEADILEADALDRVRKLLPQCDHIVVFSRLGIPGYGLPLPEWRARCRRFIKAGASVVAVSEPDALMGWEEYENGLILYGLGTLADDRANMTGRSLAVSLALKTNRVLSYEAQLLETSGNNIAFSTDETAKSELSAKNALLLDEASYLAEAERRALKYYEDGEFALLFGEKDERRRGPIASLLHPKSQATHRETEEQLRQLLLDESKRRVVLCALNQKKRSEN
jgi:hypothetical protein